MAITVNFKTPNGILNSRNLPKNTGISIYGKLTGTAGIGEPGTHIRMEILDSRNNSIFFDETTANVFGDYNFWFRTPNKDKRLTIVLIATYSISGQDIVRIPIGIGNINASPAPSPEIEGKIFDYIPMILLAAGTVFAIKMINEK